MTNIQFDNDGLNVVAVFPDIEDIYVIVGTNDQFQDWITANEDMSDFVVEKFRDYDGDDFFWAEIYADNTWAHFNQDEYYIKFYDHQIKLKLTQIKQFSNQTQGAA